MKYSIYKLNIILAILNFNVLVLQELIMIHFLSSQSTYYLHSKFIVFI